MKLVDVAPTRKKDQDGARRLLLISLLSGGLLRLVHAVDVQNERLNDRVIEGEAALLQHVVLPKAVEQSGLGHGSHHLRLQALVLHSPEVVPVLRSGVLEHDGLPRPLVPVALRPGGDVDAAAQDARPQPCSEHRLLVESCRDFVHVQLADREHSARDADLGCTFEVPLERLHLQRRTHQDDSQVRASLQQVPDEDHVEVGQLVSLVDLVEDHMRNAFQLSVLEHPPAEDAQGGKDQFGVDVLDARRHLVADVLANVLATLHGDALREGGRGQLPGLHAEDLRLRAGIQDELGDLSGLPAARLADEQAHLIVADRLDNLLPLLEPRQLLAYCLHLLVERVCPPLFERRLHEVGAHGYRPRKAANRAAHDPHIVRRHIALGGIACPTDPVRSIFISLVERCKKPGLVVWPIPFALASNYKLNLHPLSGGVDASAATCRAPDVRQQDSA
mmetsp:Transcript_134763/g.430623  ORF Transcript_134763/g.430623 Transcript_134763/m.430623 type:complete len:447 (-) Transcript_134763:408-1748(-)